MGAEPSLSTTDKLLYLGRVAWSQARLPVALRRLSIAAEHMRERAFPRGAALAREGEPVAGCYLLARGRVRLSRRGTFLGEAGPGSLVGLKVLLSQDELGIGVAASTDVLALQLDSDTLLGILGDAFPLMHEAIRAASRDLLALVRRLPGRRDESAGLPLPQAQGRPMNLVELLLSLRTPGAPFERSSVDALAELVSAFRQARFEPGHVFWREGEAAERLRFVVEGGVTCTSARGDGARTWRVGPGRPLGMLEASAGEPHWYDAVAETEGMVLEQEVDDLADLFEDNVDAALDYLAWVSRTTLRLIEDTLGPSRDLLEFFTTKSRPTVTLGSAADETADGAPPAEADS